MASLLASGVPVGILSPHSETALHVAGIKGDPATVRALLAAGAEVNARNPPGQQRHMTPLMWAAYGGHAEMVELLLAGGADPALKDELGNTAAAYAKEAGHAAVQALLEGRSEL